MIPSKMTRTVNLCGADAGSILEGAGRHNRGLRLRILQEQIRGNAGAIRGGFIILQAGDNLHAPSIRHLLGRATDAQEVVRAIRELHPGSVNIVNANILVPG